MTNTFNLPSSVPSSVDRSQVEHPIHLDFMMNYRVRECTYFINGKCKKDIPYTCFNWHHPTQRRRPSIRNQDCSSNYSSDIYCQLYDESTGVCPNGDGCPYIHRVSGNIEKMYHVDIFRTVQCDYGLDKYGACSKNGRLCAFAHGPQDMRQRFPTLPASEPYQLVASYKTESCFIRNCNGAYCCLYYHGDRDRRRSLEIYPRRSLPCPYVKKNGYWQSPENCPMKDTCQFCHTANELCYHPQIFKTQVCGQLKQIGKCQRGVFCAFAHNQWEMRFVPVINQLEPTAISDESQLLVLEAPGFLKRPPGIPTPSNLPIQQLDIGSFDDQIPDSGLLSSSSQDPWSIWSSSNNPDSALLSRGSRYNSSSSEECSDMLKMLEEEQEAILKSFGVNQILDDETLKSSQISPVGEVNTVFSVPVKLSNYQKFDIFEDQEKTGACSRCGRDKDGSGNCPVCSK